MTAAAAAERAPGATPTGKPAGHEWVAAATVDMNAAQAKRADLRGSFRVQEQTRIDVLETYCKNCRKPYEEVARQVCSASQTKDHLIGGPTGHRQKRTGHGIPGHDCVALGCNTGIALVAQQQEAARRNGAAPDTRQARSPAPVILADHRREPPRPPGIVVISLQDAARRLAEAAANARRARRANPDALTLF